MFNLKDIPASKEDLDGYEVDNLFHSWCYPPAQAPLRVVSAKGIRFTKDEIDEGIAIMDKALEVADGYAES